MIPGIYASTRDKKAFYKVVLMAVILEGILSLILSFLAYLAYGS